MEFFNWVLIVQVIYAFATYTQTPTVSSLQQQMYVSFGVAAGVFVVCLILGGIGLTQMAKGQGVKPSVLAFLPFANTYYAGKVAGEAYFFGQKMKRGGLYAMLAEIVYVTLNSLFYAFDSMLLPHGAFVQTGDTITFEYVNIPDDLQWANNALTPLNALSYIAEITMFVFFFVVFLALFKKYYAKRPVLMTVLSAVFPFRAFTLFAVRNNTPVDYNAFLRRRAEAYARQAYGNPPQGGYGGQGGYSNPNGQNAGGNPGGAPDPFGEFGSSPNPPANGANGSDNSGGASGSDGGNDSPFSDF